MKIVVRDGRNIGIGWFWSIVDENYNKVATSFHDYGRKSDAKRGAARFEQKLYVLYTSALDLRKEDINLGMPIEVID